MNSETQEKNVTNNMQADAATALMAPLFAPLFAALARAGANATAALKDSRHEHFKFQYASAESVLAEAREALHKEGLALVPLSEELGPPTPEERQVELIYLLTHADGGSLTIRRTWPVIPDRGRPIDKALAGATTTCLAYVLRDLLLLPRLSREEEQEQTRGPRGPLPRPSVVPTSVVPVAPAPEVETMREEIKSLLPQVPVEKREAVSAALAAAGTDATRLRAGLAFVRGLVDQAQADQSQGGGE